MIRPPAPIVIFAYRRPEHLRRTLTALMACDGFDDSPVIVYCDGPKNATERQSTEAVREVLREMLGNRAEYHFSETNQGLAQSVIQGVSEVTHRFGRAIVLEDDLLVAPNFLRYMHAALDRYADDPAVFQVSGYMFDVPEFARRRTAMFLPFTVSWGWGTWQRAWKAFDLTAAGWERLRSDRSLRRRFNLEGAYDYANMLEDQMMGRIDSWAVRWYWAVFRSGGLVLFPPRSLVANTGVDGTGTHGRGWLTKFGLDLAHLSDSGAFEFPKLIQMNARDFELVRAAIWRQNGGWLGRPRMHLRRLMKHISRSRGAES